MVRTQSNMRIHILVALGVLAGAILLGASRVELGILLLTIAAVMVAEMINTAIESTVDLVTREYHPMARVAKHVAAGAVLLAAVAAVFVGYLIFFDRVAAVAHTSLGRLAEAPEMATLVSLCAVVVLAVLIKAGVMPFRIQGGLPSAHTAMAFALGTAISLIGKDPRITLFALGIAALVGQARIEGKIHSLFEVVVGAALGILVTVVAFQLLVR